MNRSLVLADSSAWVSHLTESGGSISEIISTLLDADRVVINEVVRLEVLTGARDEAQYTELSDMFLGLPLLSVSGVVWSKAERLRYELRRKGHVVPVPDVVIASCALVYDCELLHVDRHFDLIARMVSLRICHVSVR